MTAGPGCSMRLMSWAATRDGVDGTVHPPPQGSKDPSLKSVQALVHLMPWHWRDTPASVQGRFRTESTIGTNCDRTKGLTGPRNSSPSTTDTAKVPRAGPRSGVTCSEVSRAPRLTSSRPKPISSRCPSTQNAAGTFGAVAASLRPIGRKTKARAYEVPPPQPGPIGDPEVPIRQQCPPTPTHTTPGRIGANRHRDASSH